MNKRKPNQLIILLSILAWSITATQLVVLVIPGIANGYELSIYAKISSTCWILFGVSTVIHTGLVVAQSVTPRPKAHFAYLGIAGIAANTILIVALPIIRDYYSFGGDFSSHITTSTEILSTLNFGRENFYPALFGLIQVFHVITGIDILHLWFWGSSVFYLLGIGFALMIGERLFKETRYALWLGLAAAIPVAGGYLSPMNPASISVRLLLLLFYLYVTSRKPGATAHKVMLIMLALLYPFLHPLTAIMAVVWLPIIEISLWIINRKVLQQHTKIILASSGILGITWFMWFSSFSILQSQVRSVLDWLVGEANNQLSRLTMLVGKSGLSTVESIWLVFKQENGVIIFTALAITGLSYFLYLSLRANRLNETIPILFAILFLLLVSVLFVIFGLIGPFEGLDLYRFSRFTIPWSTIGLISIIFLFRRISRKKLPGLSIASTLFISALIFMGYLAVYPSPFIFQPNDQVTVQQIKCMQWVDQHNQKGWSVRGIWGTRRIAIISLGYSKAKKLSGSLTPFPNHFGYDNNQYIIQNYPDPFYLVISEYDRQSVLNLWANANKFTSDDFNKLTSDPTINLVYSDNECEVWSTVQK